MTSNKIWLPTGVDEIKKSFAFESKDVLKKNLAYNIQYLEYLAKNIKEEETTSVLYSIRYKMFIIISMAMLEAVFIALLDERNLIPYEEWKDGTHHKKIISEDRIEVSFNRHRVKPYKKKVKFDEALCLIKKNKILDLNEDSIHIIKELQNLRNHLHLDKAQYPLESDYFKFDSKMFFITKMVFYYIMKDKSVSIDTKYIEFLHPTKSDFEKYIQE